MNAADAANGEPTAQGSRGPASSGPSRPHEFRDDEAQHLTGEDQAVENRENEPPA